MEITLSLQSEKFLEINEYNIVRVLAFEPRTRYCSKIESSDPSILLQCRVRKNNGADHEMLSEIVRRVFI